MTISEIKKSAKLNLAQKYPQAIIATFLFAVIGLGLDILLEYGMEFAANAPLLRLLYRVVHLLIYVPLTFGLISLFLDYSRNKTAKSTDFIPKSMTNFGKLWQVVIKISVRVAVAIVIGLILAVIFIGLLSAFVDVTDETSKAYMATSALFILIISISAFVVFLPYAFSLYILADDPSKESDAILEESTELLKDQKINLVLLYLSFIGWFFGIAALAVILTNLTKNIYVEDAVYLLGTILLSPYILISVTTFYDDIKESKTVEAKPKKKVASAKKKEEKTEDKKETKKE